jgi:Uma2 family endonuclease
MPASVEPVSFLRHPEDWTLAEVLALPEGSHVELVDGAVVVSPAPTSKHQRVQKRLEIALDAATPRDCEMLPGVNVVLNGERLLIPDLVVVTEPDVDVLYYKGTDVLLAAEVISPSSRVYDRALKRQLYAEAGVPFYLLVDPADDPVSSVLYQLDGDEYRESARSERGLLSFDEPFPARVDLAASGR